MRDWLYAVGNAHAVGPNAQSVDGRSPKENKLRIGIFAGPRPRWWQPCFRDFVAKTVPQVAFRGRPSVGDRGPKDADSPVRDVLTTARAALQLRMGSKRRAPRFPGAPGVAARRVTNTPRDHRVEEYMVIMKCVDSRGEELPRLFDGAAARWQ
jgi:hypothetical protein